MKKFASKLKAALFVSSRSVTILGMLLVGMLTSVTTAHPAHADGTKTGSWEVKFADNWDNWYTFGWSANPEKGTTATRSWSGTDTTFTGAQRDGRFLGTVYPPGDPVGYDCYVFDAYWGGKDNGSDGKFKQLWAWRRKNTWSGPVNVQAILKYWELKSGTSLKINKWYAPSGFSIMNETFGTTGTFRLENIRIPDLNTLNPLPTPGNGKR